MSDAERKARAEKALSEKPDGVVEAIASAADVTPAEILARLRGLRGRLAPDFRFDRDEANGR